MSLQFMYHTVLCTCCQQWQTWMINAPWVRSCNGVFRPDMLRSQVISGEVRKFTRKTPLWGGGTQHIVHGIYVPHRGPPFSLSLIRSKAHHFLKPNTKQVPFRGISFVYFFSPSDHNFSILRHSGARFTKLFIGFSITSLNSVSQSLISDWLISITWGC